MIQQSKILATVNNNPNLTSKNDFMKYVGYLMGSIILIIAFLSMLFGSETEFAQRKIYKAPINIS